MEDNTPSVEMTCKASGRGGKVKMLVTWEGGSFTDHFDITNAMSRARFIKRLLTTHEHLKRDDVEQQLERLAAEFATKAIESEDDEDLGGDDDEILIGLGSDPKTVELFHSGDDATSEAYARIRIHDHFVVYGVRSRSYRNWLRHEFFSRLKRSPTSEHFTSALATIESMALFDGENIPVHLRVAPTTNGVAIDLCDDNWSVVLVTATGWRVVSSEDSPVRYIRKRGMRALPMPVAGGSIHELRPFVNIPSEDGWVLFVCTLASIFTPRGPYVVLTFNGEQGSAKSTTVKRARSLTDPNEAPVRRMPKDDRDLMIAANNSFVQAFDNLSHISPAMSDALCSLATGGGYATRMLFTDDDEVIFNHQRPVFMNGITDFVTRPDLLDRCLILSLPTIPETARRDEKEMDAAFAEARPRIFGAILDAVATGLRRLDGVRIARKPRMADFARWCVAVEPAFGFAPGSFLVAYRRNRDDAIVIALESSVVYTPLQAFMQEHESWSGSAGDLLRLLEARLPDSKGKDGREWPRSGKGMAEALKRIAPALRHVGIEVITGERSSDLSRTRLIQLRRIAMDGMDVMDDVPATSGGGDASIFEGKQASTSEPDPTSGSNINASPAPNVGEQSSRPSRSSNDGNDEEVF